MYIYIYIYIYTFLQTSLHHEAAHLRRLCSTMAQDQSAVSGQAHGIVTRSSGFRVFLFFRLKGVRTLGVQRFEFEV